MSDTSDELAKKIVERMFSSETLGLISRRLAPEIEASSADLDMRDSHPRPVTRTMEVAASALTDRAILWYILELLDGRDCPEDAWGKAIISETITRLGDRELLHRTARGWMTTEGEVVCNQHRILSEDV